MGTVLQRGSRVTPTGRVLLVLAGLLLCGGFGLAASVTPDPRGWGTHQRFGFPPCSILSLYGVPCPSCGMTTSFAHFVRGNLVSACRANFAGCALACLCAALIPWCWSSAILGRCWGVDAPAATAALLGVAVVLISLLNWGCVLVARNRF